MKKRLALLCALLMFSSSALADTLTIDLDSATNDELRDARDAINECLVQRNLNPETADGELMWESDGNLEIGGFSCDAPLLRIIAYVNNATTFTATINGETTEDEITQSISEYGNGPVTWDSISVKATMPWSLHISPIVEGGTVLEEGSGPFVGNLFTLNQPVKLRLKATWPERDGFDFALRDISISLVTVTRTGMLEETEELKASLSSGDTATQEFTLLPDSRYERYFWHCECMPGVEWSIRMQ